MQLLASLSALTFRGPGLIVDIGINGCRVQSQVAVKKDDEVGLLIQLPGHPKPLHIKQAVIKWANNEHLGVEFIQMDLNDRQRLHETVENTLRLK